MLIHLIEPRTTTAVIVSWTICWTLPHQSWINIIPYIWIVWKHFLNDGPLLLDDSNLFQAHTTLAGISCSKNKWQFNWISCFIQSINCSFCSNLWHYYASCDSDIWFKESYKYTLEKRYLLWQMVLVKLDGCIEECKKIHTYLSSCT